MYEPTVFNKIALDDYDLEYSSDDFDAPVVKRPFLGESIKSASRITKSTSAAVESSTTASKTSIISPKPSKPVPTAFKSAVTSVKSSFCPVPVDKISDIREGPKKLSKRMMTIKTTELTANESFELNNFVTKDFFVEVFLSLVLSKGVNSTRLKDMTKNYRRLISKYKEAYFEDAGYTPLNLPYAQQIALYECTKIQTAYYNNIKTHFGNRLRNLINKLFKKKEKAESLRGEMQANKSSSKVIKEAIRKTIYRPCNRVKLAIAKKEMPEVGLLDDQSRTQFNDFLSSYPEDYTFQKNSIYYDVMASPKNHFKAFLRLAQLSEAEQTKQFACFPLRSTFIPCYMTLDSKIIHYHILKSKKNPKTGSKFETWGAAVDLNKKAFKNQGFQKSLRFQGTLETDGVGVSIIKQNTDTSRKSPKPNTEKKVDGNQTEHIEGLTQAELKSTEGKCVLIDPGRQDLMYCMKETSTVEEKQTLIFTKNNRSKCSRHFRYLRKNTQPFVVQKAKAVLSRSESNSVNLKKFVQYIKTRASVKNTLYEYYANETTKSKETYFPESEFDFRVDQKCNLYYGNLFIARIDGFFPQPENYSTDSLTISTALEKLQLLHFRKLKFSSKLFFDQNDKKLVRSLRAKFGQDAVLFFGDWSAPNVKYQESTRSKGLIRMLKNGFVVYLINEYKTSSHCPTCENGLEKFKTVPNPHPY
ncbi:hypothetical protein RO3G_09906 [Rhizopus delemar RA 99-880]|uniref:Uncharacterized protein n=1 Tax=Rhizopus delemar (strain RA 99-880 / ATCC MYA-4621 / FGSC 9543 / NRRL 43880) TaxID=246409 RepID=I1C9R6_RHIO9|nr:hypothetical protein RO3G_09906 [Rhizopus delemar RA 99-880]|eukprot:EIE85196.1 hypothetical protein RO3G_09906 [Rhizopus delemar RA 99-880]